MSIHEAERAERGFTLIELLVVVAIIGILAAIAIPFFSTYRATSFDSHAAQALNTLAKAEEAYFARNGNYATNVAGLPAYYPPNGVVVNLGTVSVSGFTAQSYHPEGTRTYTWDSSNGGLQP